MTLKTLLTTRFTVATIVVLVLVPALLLAQPPGHRGPGFGPGRGMGWHGEQLDLTPAQQDALDQLQADHRQEMQPQHEAVRSLHQQLQERVRAELLDETAIRDLTRDLADVEVELAAARWRHQQEMREILSPEQQAQLDETFADGRAMRGFRGKGPGEGFGPPSDRGHRGWKGEREVGTGAGRMGWLAERLDLTPEQQEALAAIFASHRENAAEQRQAVREAARELHEMSRGEFFDRAAAQELAANLAEARAELAMAGWQFLQEIRQILTPEQQAEAEDWFNDVHGMGPGFGGGFGHRFGGRSF